MRYIFGRRGQRRVHGWRIFYRLRTEVLLHSPAPISGLTQSTEVRVWVDGEVFPRIEKLLLRARHTVVIQMFIWKDDTVGRRIASTLLRSADRGVKVDITKEAVGDVFEFGQDFLATRDIKNPLWKRFWSHPNIRITYATNNDHAKVYIIDEKILLLTGMNIADEYHNKLHDYLVELRGSSFVEHYLTHGDVPVHPSSNVQLAMNTEVRKDIRKALTDIIGNAKYSIVVEHCYVSDPKILDLLADKSKAGVNVTLIVPAELGHNYYMTMQAVYSLLDRGDRKRIRIFRYPRMFHGKIILVDRATAFVGSANLMKSSIDDMGEVNVRLEGRTEPAVQKIRDILREDILLSEPLTKLPRFPWLVRWLAWLQL
jgi:cardiolipin synthase